MTKNTSARRCALLERSGCISIDDQLLRRENLPKLLAICSQYPGTEVLFNWLLDVEKVWSRNWRKGP